MLSRAAGGLCGGWGEKFLCESAGNQGEGVCWAGLTWPKRSAEILRPKRAQDDEAVASAEWRVPSATQNSVVETFLRASRPPPHEQRQKHSRGRLCHTRSLDSAAAAPGFTRDERHPTRHSALSTQCHTSTTRGPSIPLRLRLATLGMSGIRLATRHSALSTQCLPATLDCR
jgi:hypothetical protein